MITHTDPADIQAEYCHQEHTTRPDADCESCAIRAETVHCGTCGADYTDGRWFTALGSTAPNGCDHENLVDDWDREIRCAVARAVCVGADPAQPHQHAMHGHTTRPCGDAVTTPGKTACDHHQRIADQEECGRLYQRMVAAS